MKQTSRFFLAIILLHFLSSNSVFGQNSNNQSLYEYFDTVIGKQNLYLNNGTIHINNLRSSDKTHRYFNADQYVMGSIAYDGQPYTDVALKYDELDDIIIAKAQGENNTLGINLITEKTAYFKILNKTFVNLNYETSAPKFVKGFYEEEVVSKNITFYTKYHKDNIEVLRSNGVFYKYEETKSYVFEYQNKLYDLRSKSDVIVAFPTLKKDIDAFYAKSSVLENGDKKLFYKTLLTNIGSWLANQTN